LAEVRAALESEPLAHLTIVHTADDGVLAGQADACARVLARLPKHRSHELGYELAVHCAEVEPFSATWRAVHRRATRSVPGVRFYTHATNASYEPTADAVADALTTQAVSPIELPRVLDRAYADG